ncbi:MAG: hypothetical protein WC322_06525 [Candidatus Paceibacterota bacterium]
MTGPALQWGEHPNVITAVMPSRAMEPCRLARRSAMQTYGNALSLSAPLPWVQGYGAEPLASM